MGGVEAVEYAAEDQLLGYFLDAADGHFPPADGGVSAPVFAAVSPGNARSLRAFLAAGFAPIGAEVLIRPHHPVTEPA